MEMKTILHPSVLRIARFSRLLITIIATLLAFFFTWLQIRDIDLTPLENAKSEFIQKFALILYYLSWIFGTRADTSAQEGVYAEVPTTWRITATTAAMIVAFVAVAGFLLWATGDARRFAIALSVFVAFNIAGWRYINNMMRPIMSQTRKRFYNANSYFELEKLNVVTSYLVGTWQQKRFAAMCAFVIILDVICFVPDARSALALNLHMLASDLREEVVARLLPDILLLLFVLMAEIWIWIMRVKVRNSLNILDELQKRYVLNPQMMRSS